MSSINRPLTAPNLIFDLQSHLQEMRGEESYQRSGRTGRTLAKSGRMRVTLVAMERGNVIGTHQADSPLTLHVISGHVRFRAGGTGQELSAGQVLFFGPGDAHDITATEDTALLLTLSAIGDDFSGDTLADVEEGGGPSAA